MNGRKYLNVLVTRKDGSHFPNPLKLNDVREVSKLAQSHQRIVVRCEEVSDKEFKKMFPSK